jgi:thiol-disulfide isomerase/thioredoxin
MTTSKSRAKKTPAANAAHPKRKFPILGVSFGVIAVVLVVAMLASGDEPLGTGGEFGDPQVTGDALVPFGASPDPAVGEVAPEVVGEDFDGNAVSISHDGTPKAIVFLAHWCPHCQAEVPEVTAWLNATGGVDGVELISVTTSISSAQDNFPPSDWLRDAGWPVGVIRDDTDSSVLRAYGSGGFPYWVFVDGEGQVVARNAGRIGVDALQSVMTDLAALGG